MFKKWKNIILCFAMSVSLFSLTACKAKKTQVAYTVYPLGYLLDRIAGDTVTKVSIQDSTLVQKASIVDDYEDILKNSAVLFHIGNLEPYLSVYGNDLKEAGIQEEDLSVMNAIYDFRRYTKKADGDFTESDYYDGEQFQTLDTNDLDLNLWMDPIAMLSMGKDIEKWLAQYYPENASYYEENLNSLETDLINLDAQYQNLANKLDSAGATIRFATMSASFGNWQKTYGFEVYPIVLSKFGSLPTDQQLDAIKERLKQDNVQYLVYEPNMTDDMKELYDSLQEELGMTRVQLSNLSSETSQEEADGKDYLSIMYENLNVLGTLSAVSLTGTDK